VPRTLERTAYVGISSLLLAGTVAAWQAVPGIAWSLSPGFLGWAGSATQLAAAAWMALAFRAIDIRSLAGLDGGPGTHPGEGQVLTRGPFAVVRHPIYLGWMVALWAAPVMTGTRLVFAAASSAYLVVALRWEERDLARDFGPAYRDYCRTVPWRIVPWIWGLVLVAAA
jgi:protein-S-isoprenylcysteine O-methyltransferase Ste14